MTRFRSCSIEHSGKRLNVFRASSFLLETAAVWCVFIQENALHNPLHEACNLHRLSKKLLHFRDPTCTQKALGQVGCWTGTEMMQALIKMLFALLPFVLFQLWKQVLWIRIAVSPLCRRSGNALGSFALGSKFYQLHPLPLCTTRRRDQCSCHCVCAASFLFWKKHSARKT